MKRALLAFALLAGAETAPASCPAIKPAITAAVATSDGTGQNATVAWTTNVPADSLVGYGIQNPGTFTAVTDLGGVTNHVVMITGLQPAQTYGLGIRSQAIDQSVAGGAGCGTGFFAYYGGAANGFNVTMHGPPPAGPFTYQIVPLGPTYVTQGYEMYFQLCLVPLTGTYTPHSLRMVLNGLPQNTTIQWSDTQLWNVDVDTITGAMVPGDTVDIHAFDCKEPDIKTSATTPIGNYTITITVSGTGGPTVVATWPLNVVPSTAAFNGIPFPYGKPSAYPQIPNLPTFVANASKYGAETCAQDQDFTPRTIRPNDPNNLTPVAPCCTYGSWDYDGVRVYKNVANLVKDGQNWNQCVVNVQQVYRDKYALSPNPIPTYMQYGTGAYVDYLQNEDPADLQMINKFMRGLQYWYHGSWVGLNLQREVSFVSLNTTHGVALGQDVTDPFGIHSLFWRDYAENHVLGMIDQICLSKNAQYWENFMTGLQFDALVQYYDLVTHDPRIPPAIACLADYLYANQWEAINVGSFPYDKYQWGVNFSYANGSTDCQNTLNNLISPMYAWLWMMTGDPKYQAEGDAIFSHGVLFDCFPGSTPANFLTFPFGSDGKFFSQQYYLGTSYVSWRSPKAVACVYQ